MNRLLMSAAAAAATLSASPSMAGIFLTSATAGSNTYTGPAPSYDFESATPLTGGGVGSTNNANRARPTGSTGNFATFGPTYGTGTLTSASLAYAKTISLLWGSVDTGNKIEFLDGAGTLLASFTGSDVLALASGYTTYDQRTNPVVYFTLTGAESAALRSIRFSSTTDSFEIDNVAVAVPEPATWGMMVLGFAAAGIGLRRRRAVKAGAALA